MLVRYPAVLIDGEWAICKDGEITVTSVSLVVENKGKDYGFVYCEKLKRWFIPVIKGLNLYLYQLIDRDSKMELDFYNYDPIGDTKKEGLFAMVDDKFAVYINQLLSVIDNDY